MILVVYAEVPTKMPSVETYYDYYYNANKYRVVYRFYKFFTTGEGIWSGSLVSYNFLFRCQLAEHIADVSIINIIVFSFVKAVTLCCDHVFKA